MNLGLTATGPRQIRPGKQFDKYFDFSELENDSAQLLADTTTEKTVNQMHKIARRYRGQTEKIADVLYHPTLSRRLRNLWNFLYNHVQFREDDEQAEQLRTPLRTWADRQQGVDCDCYSIFIGSVLHNWKDPFAFRRVDFGEGWQHVYVVVPKKRDLHALRGSRTAYYALDPVVDRFNYEKPFKKKSDTTMKLEMLSGLALRGTGRGLSGCCCSDPLQASSKRGKIPEATALMPAPELISLQELEIMDQVATEKLLDEQNIPYTTGYRKTDGKPVVIADYQGKKIPLPTVLDRQRLEVMAPEAEIPDEELIYTTQATVEAESEGQILPSPKLITAAAAIGLALALLAALPDDTSRQKMSGTTTPSKSNVSQKPVIKL
jgi:hypothetical protein